MKRIGSLVCGALLASVIAGCDSGINEGMPTSGPMEPQSSNFKETMKTYAGKMQNQKAANKNAAKATPAPTPEETK